MKAAFVTGFWRVTEMAKHRIEAVTAMICITILDGIALMKGIDGMFLSTVIASLLVLAVSGLGERPATTEGTLIPETGGA
jgi:hypothetical protein